jgi:hypothetical protein
MAVAVAMAGWQWRWLGGSGWVAVDVAVGKWLSNGPKMSQIGVLLTELSIVNLEFAEKVAMAVGVAVAVVAVAVAGWQWF